MLPSANCKEDREVDSAYQWTGTILPRRLEVCYWAYKAFGEGKREMKQHI